MTPQIHGIDVPASGLPQCVVGGLSCFPHAWVFPGKNNVHVKMLILTRYHAIAPALFRPVRCLDVHYPASRIQYRLHLCVPVGHCGGTRLRRLPPHFPPKLWS